MGGHRGVSGMLALGRPRTAALSTEADPARKTERPLQGIQDDRHIRAWSLARCQLLERLDEERSGSDVLAMRPDKPFNEPFAGGATDLRRLDRLGHLLRMFGK